MDRTLLIVDDFYDNPDQMRQTALSLPFDRTGRFPGANSPNYDVEGSMKRVVHALRVPIQVGARQRDVSLFRLTKGSDEGSADIHVDPCTWAGVVYLNPEPPTDAGTSFFRHKATRLTGWPTAEQVGVLLGPGLLPREAAKGRAELESYFADEGRDRSKWDEILHVPNVYNRAIFYKARQFHSIRAWDAFGETPAEARLTHLLFFEGRSVEQ